MHKEFTPQGFRKAKEIVNAINLMGGNARIRKTWMDYGANISWETISVTSKKLNMDYQLLSPADFDRINSGEISAERIKEMILEAVK